MQPPPELNSNSANARCPDCGEMLPQGVGAWLCPICALEDDSETEPAETLPRLGKYTLLCQIGRGGMGVVYKARQDALNRVVALKVLPGAAFSEADLRQRFAREAESAARLRHPHIVAIHEAGEHLGQPYLSMDFIEGQSLAERLAGGALPAAFAAHVIRQISLAVEHAHEQGVTHRDLKPSNIMLSHENVPYLVDFGLARLREHDGTLSSLLMGSPNYLPPERISGGSSQHAVGEDIYGLGAMLYHCLTGRPPFVADSLPALLAATREADPLPPGRLKPGLPPDLETICLKCLEKNAGSRYATAGEVAAELDRFLTGEPILARPLGVAGKAWRWARRRPTVALLAVSLVAVMIVGTIVSSVGWKRASENAVEASRQAEKRRIQLYSSEIYEAAAVLNSDPGDARRHLAAAVPQPGETDLRGVEWYFLREALRPRTLARLDAHQHILNSLAWHPNGRQLLSASHDGVVKLWNWGEGNLTLAGQMHFQDGAHAPQVEWLPDGNAYLFASKLGWIELRRPSEPEPIWKIKGAAYSLTADGGVLAVSTGLGYPYQEPGVISLWKLSPSQPPELMREFEGRARAVAISGDGRWLASGIALQNNPDQERGVLLRDLEKPEAPPRILNTSDAVWALKFSPDGGRLAATLFSSRVELPLFNTETAAPAPFVTGHSLRPWMAAFTADSETLVSVSSDRSIKAARLSDGEVTTFLGGHENEVWSVAMHPSGKLLATGDKDGTLTLTPFPLPQPTLLEWPQDRYEHLVFSPDSASIIRSLNPPETGGWQTHVTSLPDGRDQRLPDGAPCLGLSAKGERVSFSQHESCLLLRTEDQLVSPRRIALPFLNGRKADRRDQMGVSRSGRYFHVLCGDGLAARVELGSGKASVVQHFLADDVLASAMSDDGRFLVASSWLELVCHDFSTATTLRISNDPHWARTLDFSPDGKLLATGGISGRIELRRLPDLALHATLRGHREEASFVKFSPDGKTLVSSEIGVGLRFWRLDSLRQVLEVPIPNADAIELSPDGCWLAVTRCASGQAKDTGVVRLLPMPR